MINQDVGLNAAFGMAELKMALSNSVDRSESWLPVVDGIRTLAEVPEASAAVPAFKK